MMLPTENLPALPSRSSPSSRLSASMLPRMLRK